MFKEKNQWYITIVGFGGAVLATIINLMINPQLSAILGFFTGALILLIVNIVIVLYKQKKKPSQKNNSRRN